MKLGIRNRQRLLASVMSLLVAAGSGTLTAAQISRTDSSAALTASAAAFETGNRIRVDINKNDGRKASYSKNANNWIVDSTYTYTVNGITCKLSGSGGSVDVVNNKILQLQSLIYPRLTMDGAKIKDVTGTPTLTLTISGLSNGTHSIQTWHACADRNVTNSTLTVKVNGSTVASGLTCPVNPTSMNDAATAYGTFSGTSVTVTVTADGNGSLNTPWLNGFEIDGSDPVNGVSKMVPEDQEAHLDASQGLSWKAGSGAASHNVYIGTSYHSVFNATTSSAEFKGNQTATKYALDDTYSSIPTYYWRVDEVKSDGTVTKGAVYSFQINRLAFPTAEGYGRYARGGRGGTVYHVTNLNDSGAGSLRYGCESLTGDRTIVFDVGGIIELQSKITIPEEGGNVYVAGQTAPGDGITLTKWGFGMIGCDDVIVRDIRVRAGDRGLSGVNDVSDGMGLSSCNHCIIDHCSMSWATDEGFSSRSAANITFQWNIIGESLHDSIHYNADDRTKTETHAFAASISGFTGSFHHNLLIDCTGRNWSMAGGMEQDAVTYGGQIDVRNNVVYNWRDRTTDGGVRRLNFVNNYYKAGASSNTGLHVVSIDGNELNSGDMQKMYVSGNIMTNTSGGYVLKASDDAWNAGKAVTSGYNCTLNDVKSTSPFFESYVNTQTAEEAYAAVIVNAGASAPGFDYIDTRYHNEVKNGTYTYTGSKQGLKGIIDSQKDAGGYPTSSNFKSGTAAADSDGDGISDTWETAHGLNPNNAADGAIVSLSDDDYTNLELYLNELAGDNVDFNGGKRGAVLDTQYKYTITNVGSGLYLNCADSTPASGSNVQQGTEAQTWQLVDAGEGYYYIYSTLGNGSYCVDLPYGSADNGTSIGLWSNDESDARKFKFVDNGDGSYTICTKSSGDNSCFGVISGSKEAGADVIQWTCDGTDSQKWVLTVKLDPINGNLIQNLDVYDAAYYSSWAIDDSLAVGDLLFGDRDVTYATVPDELLGAEAIVTPCDAKALTTDLASFTAGADITVSVALDVRVVDVQNAFPSWLSDWTKTDLTVTNSKDVTFYIYQKTVSAGEVVTLGSNGTATSVVNYVVFAQEAGASSETLYLGDADCNGDVELADAVLLAKSLGGTGVTLSAQGRTNADCNQDGNVDAQDLSLLLQHISGKIVLTK